MANAPSADSRNLADRFERQAAAAPDRPAVLFDGGAVTFRELDQRANQVARLLRVKSVGPADRVGVMLGPGVRAIETTLGALKARAVPVDLDPPHGTAGAPLATRFTEAAIVGLFVLRADTPRVVDVVGDLPDLNFFVVVDDGSDTEVALPNAVSYDEGLQAYEPEQEWGVRDDHDLYGRLVDDADGRPVLTVVTHAELHAPPGRPPALVDPALADLLDGSPVVLPHR